MAWGRDPGSGIARGGTGWGVKRVSQPVMYRMMVIMITYVPCCGPDPAMLGRRSFRVCEEDAIPLRPASVASLLHSLQIYLTPLSICWRGGGRQFVFGVWRGRCQPFTDVVGGKRSTSQAQQARSMGGFVGRGKFEPRACHPRTVQD